MSCYDDDFDADPEDDGHDDEDPPQGYWRTKDGKVLAMADMTDDHLKNTIAMLKRKKMRWHWKYAQLQVERKKREQAGRTRAAEPVR
jgi:hypothetical protein